MEYNLVDRWLKKDPTRWLAGALAGLFAGLIMAGLAMWLSTEAGLAPTFPIKLVASTLLGPSATEIGASSYVIAVGFLIHETLALFLGILFAQFVTTNAFAALSAMGLVWGVFSWIFLWNLFFQSFHSVLAAHVSSAVVFPVCLTFGLALNSLGFFDRLVRG